jgi:hypothetical protein
MSFSCVTSERDGDRVDREESTPTHMLAQCSARRFHDPLGDRGMRSRWGLDGTGCWSTTGRPEGSVGPTGSGLLGEANN